MIPATILAEAEAEIQHEHSYYEQKEPGKGDAFVAEVARVVNFLRRFPEGGAPHRRPPFRTHPMQVFRFSIIYVIWEGVIWIVAVAGHRRKPDYWINRKFG